MSAPRNGESITNLGFIIASSDDDIAYLHCGDCSFLLENFYNPEHADNFMMHLLVADVEAWWQHVEKTRLTTKYGVSAEPPDDRPWGMRDFTIVDPDRRAVADRTKHIEVRMPSSMSVGFR